MNRNLVLAEWARAKQSLRAAQILAREGCPEDAVSRAYYATLHAAKAVLLVHDIAADSHRAVKRLFGLHLIRTGRLEPTWSEHLSESLDDRLAADYDSEAFVSDEDARHECRRTRAFLNRVRHYLVDSDFTPKELRRRASRE